MSHRLALSPLFPIPCSSGSFSFPLYPRDTEAVATTFTAKAFLPRITYVNVLLEPGQRSIYTPTKCIPGSLLPFVHLTRLSARGHTPVTVVDIPQEIQWAFTATCILTAKYQPLRGRAGSETIISLQCCKYESLKLSDSCSTLNLCVHFASKKRRLE